MCKHVHVLENVQWNYSQTYINTKAAMQCVNDSGHKPNASKILNQFLIVSSSQKWPEHVALN